MTNDQCPMTNEKPMTKSKTIGHLKLGFNLTFACLPARQGFWNLSFRSVRSSRCRSGQMIIEYTVMFVVIVAVILYASNAFIRPAVSRYFNTVGNKIDQEINR